MNKVMEIEDVLEQNQRYQDYFRKGVYELNKNNLVEATEAFSYSIELNGENLELFLMRGIAHIEREMYAKAIDDFSNAIKLNPAHSESYSFRGLAYYNLKNYSLAIIDLSTAIILNPKDDFPGSILDIIQEKHLPSKHFY